MKKLEENSIRAEADKDGDGIVTDREIELYERRIRLDNEDQKEDAQRNMAWFALAGMLLYPFSVVLAVSLKLPQAANVLGSMASVYFVSVAAIVAAFYGGQAYTKSKDKKDES